ncbi:MAG: hypothetical protein QXO46_08305 [Nitrososphaerota archaeon]
MAEQKIKGFNILEDLELEPETLREFYTTEFFQRTLSHIFGLYENKWKAIKVTANGELVTYQSQTYVEKYDVIEVTAGGEETVPYMFTFPQGVTTTKIVEIHTGDTPVYIRFIPADDVQLEKIYHDAGMIYIRAIAIKGFTAQSVNPTSNAFVRVIGWY